MKTQTFHVTGSNQFAVEVDFDSELGEAGEGGSASHVVIRNIALELADPTTTFPYEVYLAPESGVGVNATDKLTIRNEDAGGFSELGRAVIVPNNSISGGWNLFCTSTSKAQDATFTVSYTVERVG